MVKDGDAYIHKNTKKKKKQKLYLNESICKIFFLIIRIFLNYNCLNKNNDTVSCGLQHMISKYMTTRA